MTYPRYASAQDAARAAAEAAQIIRRNEAQNVTERERHAHALAEVARLTSLEPVKADEPPNNAAAENKAWLVSMHLNCPSLSGGTVADQPEQIAAE